MPQAAKSASGAQPPPHQPSAPADGAVARSHHLDASLEKAHRLAIGQHHGGVTLEHLLFALTEDPEALTVLGASTVDIERLRADITTHLAQLPNTTPPGKAILPTADLLKVLKLAATAAQQSARRVMDGAIVLAAIIGDASTPSAGLLKAHGLTFQEVIRVLQKAAAGGGAPTSPATPVTPPAVEHPPQPAPEFAPEPPTPAERPANTSTAVAPPEPHDPAPPESIEEHLASVRQRLQKMAPPTPPRRRQRSPSVSDGVEEAAPPAALEGHKPVVEPADQGPVNPPTVAIDPLPPAPPAAPRVETAQMPVGTAPKVEPARTAPPLPPTAPPAPQLPPAAPSPGTAARATLAAPPPATSAVIQPPPSAPPSSPPAPPIAQRRGPPPLPQSAAALGPARAPHIVQAPPPPHLPAMQNPPPAAPAIAAPALPLDTSRPPPIPPAQVDLRALLAGLPRRLRQGEPELFEIVVPRRALEIPPAAGHRWPPLRVAMLRLKAHEDDAHVEPVGPETLWISPPRVHQSGDDAIWRWRVTPRTKGRMRLSLSGATRIVGSEGITGEIPLGEGSFEIDVAKRGSRRWLVGMLLFGNLLAIGFLAMLMSGRAAELILTAWKSLRGLAGM